MSEILKIQMSRRSFFKGIIGIGATLGLPGCASPKRESSYTVSTKPTPPSPQEPVVTASSTIDDPTTSVEQRPTDVIEHRDGYDVLRNGGLLYEVESAPEFGGFELHMQSGQDEYGFKEVAAGAEKPQEVLFRDVLWTFGAQHPEFIKPEGGVDVEAYKKYLGDHDWIDTVYLPKNISTQAGTKMPPVAPSDPIELDFRKPFVLGNTDLSSIDGLSKDNANYYKPTTGDNVIMVFGVNGEGQLFYGYYEVRSNGTTKPLTMKDPFESYPISIELGDILNITSRITYPEDTPQNQWINPARYYRDPFLVNPTGVQPPYPVLNVLDFVGIDGSHGTNKLFAPVTS